MRILVVEQVATQSEALTKFRSDELNTTQTRVFDIIKQIEEFQVENATPMEAILFVNKLKQQIRNGNV